RYGDNVYSALYKVTNNYTTYTIIGSETGSLSGSFFSGSSARTARVRFQGEEVKVLLDNGAGIYTATHTTDGEYTTGNISIGTYGLLNGGATFDNFAVKSISDVADDFTLNYLTPLDPFDSPNWVIADDGTGNYVYKQTAFNDWMHHIAVMKNGRIADGEITAKFSLPGIAWNQTEYLYIYFRMDDNGNGYAIRLRRYGDNVYSALYKVTNNYTTYTIIGSETGSLSGSFFSGSSARTVKVQLQGTAVTVLLSNGTTTYKATHATDGEYTTGNVGIGTYGLINSGASFDDFSVKTSADINDNLTPNMFKPVDAFDDANWNITNGRYYQTAAGDGSYHTAFSQIEKITDGEIDTKFNLSADGSILLYFRMDENGNGYAIKIRRAGSTAYASLATVSNYAVSGGSETTFSSFFPSTGDAERTLRVTLDGTQVKVYLANDTTESSVAYTVSDTYPSGRIGIGTYALAALSSAYFDDVKIDRYGAAEIDDSFYASQQFQLTAIAPINGTWQVARDADNNYMYQQSMLDSSYHIAAMQGEPIANGTIQTDFKLQYNDDDRIVMYFRMNESGSGYAIQVRRYYDSAYVYLNLVNNYAISTQIGGSLYIANFFQNDGGAWHTLKVDFNNNLIRAYLDTQESYLLETDSTHTSGGIALGTYSLIQPAKFDNVVVSQAAESDSFSKTGASGFTPRNDGGNWRIAIDETGNYVYQQSATDANTHIAVLNNETIQDGTVEAKFKIKYDGDDRAILYFRMDTAGSGYAVQVKRDENDAYLYLYAVNNYSLDRQIGSSIKFTDLFAGTEVWHTIRVELNGYSIKAYLDNQASYINQVHVGNASGSIAIGPYALVGEAYFDDVAVSHIDLNDELTQTPETPFTSRTDGGKWDVVKDTTGNYVYQQSALDSNAHIAFLKDQTIQNGAIETKFKLGYDSDERIRLYFRLDENGNGYAAQVKRYYNDAYLYLYTVTGYAMDKQIGGVHGFGDFFLNDGGAWHTVKVMLDNSLIKVYLDSQINHINQKYDGNTLGSIAIGTYDLESEAYFDDIIVTEAPIINSFAEKIETSFTPRTDGGNWQMIDDETGNYVYMQSLIDNSTHIAMLNNQGIQNGTIEMKFKVAYASYNEEITRLYFRVDGEGNGYAVQIKRYNNDAYITLYTVKAYGYDKQIGGTKGYGNFFLNDGGAWHTVKVALDGSSIKVYLDAQASYIDQKHSGNTSGEIGIATSALVNEAYFDDIVVTEAPVINNFAETVTMPLTPRDDGGNWQMIDDGTGNYVYMQSMIDNSTHIALLDNQAIQDGSVQMKFKIAYASYNEEIARLYFRLDEQGNGYAAQIKRYNNDAYITLYTVKAYGYDKQIGGTKGYGNFFLNDGGAWHTVKVALDGSSIKVYLDDQASYINQKYDGATFGNIAIATSALVNEAYFDDIVVTEAPVINNFAETVTMPLTPRDDGGNWQMIDDGTGNYVYMQSRIDNSAHIALLDNQAIQNGTIDMKFKVAYASSNEEIARLYFRLDEQGNGYAAQIKRYNNDAYITLYTVGGYGLNKQIGNSIGFGNFFLDDGGAWHTLKVVLDNSSIKIYLDDQASYINQKHVDYTSGNVAIGTSALVNEAYFDDITVTNSPVMDDFVNTVDLPFTPRDDGGNWQLIDDGTGKKVLTQSVIDSTPHIAVLNNETVQNGTIETKFKLGYDSDDRMVVYFRMDAGGNGYAVQVRRYNNDAYIYFNNVYNYNLGIQIGGSGFIDNFFYNDGGNWHTIKVDLDNNVATISLDGVTRLTKPYLIRTSGGVAIGTLNLNNAVWFDDMKITHTAVNDELSQAPAMPLTPLDDGGNWQAIYDKDLDKYHYAQTALGGSHIAVLDDKSITDGEIETKFKLQYDSDDRVVLYFRLDENGNGYAVQIRRYNDNGYVYLNTVTNYVIGETLASWENYTSVFGATDSWHTLKIRLDGESIKVYMDNSLRIDTRHTGSKQGNIAIGTLYLNDTAYFDDVSVTRTFLNDKLSQSAVAQFTPRDDGGNWEIVDDGTGNYVYRQTIADSNTHMAMMDNMAIADGSVEAKFRLQYNSDEQARLYFRLDANGNGYAVNAKRYNNYLYVYLYTVTSYFLDKQIASWGSSYNFYSTSGEWHTMKVDLKADSIKVYVDNMAVIQELHKGS
ncbi:MAG: hypothetical protein PHQ43_07645, partial [Dehalococcoidales bacterium]|nr:hypothetical protein [Dehalococcoidales bacterium]